jgi:hypothetical protein
VRGWAQERGNHLFHLGGGRAGKDDSLLAFKARFSQRRHQFHIGRWILNADLYHALCEQRVSHARRAGLALEANDFFPRYRTRSQFV